MDETDSSGFGIMVLKPSGMSVCQMRAHRTDISTSEENTTQPCQHEDQRDDVSHSKRNSAR